MCFLWGLCLCDSTNWTEVKEDTTSNKTNSTFSFYLDNDKLKFTDSGGHFDNSEFLIISFESGISLIFFLKPESKKRIDLF